MVLKGKDLKSKIKNFIIVKPHVIAERLNGEDGKFSFEDSSDVVP